jgi:hypothetical protein
MEFRAEQLAHDNIMGMRCKVACNKSQSVGIDKR